MRNFAARAPCLSFLASCAPTFLIRTGSLRAVFGYSFLAVTRSWGSVSRGLRKNCIGE